MEREKITGINQTDDTGGKKRPCVLAQISGIRKALTGWDSGNDGVRRPSRLKKAGPGGGSPGK